jgi:predicted DNA-binding transcriptional regulator YafY
MPYERTKKIEDRFESAIKLIQKNRLSASDLARELKVSLPTAQRIVAELKHRGHQIRSVHEEHGWHYEIKEGHWSPGSAPQNKVQESKNATDF